MRSLLLVLAVLVAAAPSAQAAPCPSCPAGCVPSAWVAEWKEPQSGTSACPRGCVPLEIIRSLKDDRTCPSPEPSPGPAPSAPPAPAPSGDRLVDATRNRIIAFPTALGPPPGQQSFTGYAAALWHYEYSLNDNVTLGTFVVLPIAVAGVFPSLSLHETVSDHFAVGAGAIAGVATLYVEGDVAWATLGHAEMTFFDERSTFNLGVIAGTAGANGEVANGAVVLPNVGYRYAASRSWSFQVELTSPFVTSDGSGVNGRLWVLSYGFRLHGQTMFGDLGFTLPLQEDFIREAWKYVPLGIPYFTLGFRL